MPTPVTQPGSIKIATPEDFDNLKAMFNEDDPSFDLKHNKKGVRVWSKQSKGSPIKLLRMVVSEFAVSASTLFDILFDEAYRPTWDAHMIQSVDHCRLDNFNDIGYYSMKSPGPLKNRDLVTQRSWSINEDKSEYTIITRSVAHKDFPPTKKFIRAVSLLTGYYLKPIDDNSCFFGYVTQFDPLGSVPKFVVNMVATSTVPGTLKILSKAVAAYPKWKSENEPDYKPWLNPGTSKLPLVSAEELAEIQGSKEEQAAAAELAAETAREEEEALADQDESAMEKAMAEEETELSEGLKQASL